MVGCQSDDEPNLYVGNGGKWPFPSILNWWALGLEDGVKNIPDGLHPSFRIVTKSAFQAHMGDVWTHSHPQKKTHHTLKYPPWS